MWVTNERNMLIHELKKRRKVLKCAFSQSQIVSEPTDSVHTKSIWFGTVLIGP